MHTPISRRAALKAAGIAVALPLLESMNPVIVRGDNSITQPVQRMVVVCNTLGLHPPSLFPETPGFEYENTEYLDLLKAHRKDFTLFSGLSHPDQNGKEPHDSEMTWLSAARNPGLGGFRNSISIDQLAASKLGPVTRFPSIALSSRSQKSQSYTSNGVMLPAYERPSVVFSKLFLDGSPQERLRQRAKIADGRSILDAVADQSKQLRRRTSSRDRHQLNQYFDAIRDAELELSKIEAWMDRPKPKVDEQLPEDITDKSDLIGRTRSLMNLIPLMLQTDSTRVVSVVIQDNLSVPKIQGVSAEHHNLSHHGKDPQKIQQLKIIETEILKCFDEFLMRMARPSDPDGRLLDNTTVLFGSNLGNANAHDPRNLPIILAGGGYRHGRYVEHDQRNNTPLCNLFVNMLNNMGHETESFATSTGVLTW